MTMKPFFNRYIVLAVLLLQTSSPGLCATLRPAGAAELLRRGDTHRRSPGTTTEPAPQKKTVKGRLVSRKAGRFTVREADGTKKNIRVNGQTKFDPRPSRTQEVGIFIEATGVENAQRELVAERLVYSGRGLAGLGVVGERMKTQGVVVQRDAEAIVVQDEQGVQTTIALNTSTSIKTKGGLLRGGDTYSSAAILRGLIVEVEGRDDGTDIVAEKIRFSEKDLQVARAIEANVTPVENRAVVAENRIGEVEQNAQRLSGQLDELASASNAARGGAKAAQETADAAVSGVNETNERIAALDDYQTQNSQSIIFRVGSAVLSAEARQQLDQIAQQALNAKGYVLEVSGFASADGSTEANRRLSQRRADAVIRYLVENHNIPLRRIVTPYGYGEAQPVADNTTREGREQNRRVEVKVLVNRGLIQGAPGAQTPRQEP
jgi:OOP family OmpA-OmpF porin